MRNGLPVYVGEEKCGIGGGHRPDHKIVQKSTVKPNGEGPPAPSWLAYDKQVLRFFAYFQETVHEKREEKYRIRKFVGMF